MAGAGYKAWSAGDVLTASDVNTYLMQQSVMTFAGTAARASAVAAPSEGMLSYRTDDNVLEGYDGSQWVSVPALTARGAANVNMVINGAMQVAQRGTAATNLTTNGYATADRWEYSLGSFGTWSQSVVVDGPTGSGFAKSLKMTCGTAQASPGVNAEAFIAYHIEGQDLQRVKKGTASAEKLTLSFWTKTNKTGTYTVWLYDATNTRSVSGSYTATASDTWEKKVITFPADTTGAFPNTNTEGLLIRFYLGAGSNFTSGTLATTWGTPVDANRAVGQVNVAAAANNYWQITGVQLEVGNASTPFEFEPYETTLRKCQRYYWRISSVGGASPYQRFGIGEANSTTNADIFIQCPVTMRAAPSSLDTTQTASHYATYSAGSVRACNNVPVLGTPSSANLVIVTFTAASGLTAGYAVQAMANNTNVPYLGVSAEL